MVAESERPSAHGERAEFALSIIIPVWNDADALRALLAQLATRRGIGEVIVADASPGEQCREIAAAAGATVVRCERPSRGAQMNAGARRARGEVLLFQHADTELTQRHIDALLTAASDPRICGGAFHRRFDARHAGLRWLEWWARAWTRLGGTFYGDQSIFVRRLVFERLGGFAEIPLMEDIEFSRRLRKAGRVVALDPPLASSSRNHDRGGAWRTTVRNGLLIALYRLGVSPETLHAWYYARGSAS